METKFVSTLNLCLIVKKNPPIYHIHTVNMQIDF